MVPSGLPCADIGSDHGLLVKELIETNKVPLAYASDNKKGPFLNLSTNLDSFIKEGKIEVALKDGLDDLPSKYETIIITGMGGDLIKDILEVNFDKVEKVSYLLLGPHGKEKELREFLTSKNFEIVDENVLFEGHYYDVILFKKTSKNIKLSDFECEYGPINLKKKDPTFKKKYLDLIKSNKEILVNPRLNEERRNEIQNIISKHEEMLKKIF